MDRFPVRSLLGIGLIIICVIPGFYCRRLKKLPLIEDEVEVKESRTPGCWLGGMFHRLGDRWSPALLPHGTMVCVKCQCLPVEKKGIFQNKGHIVCKNIKHECPKPMCDDPVLSQGRCCKTCPGKDNNFEDRYILGDKQKTAHSAVSGDEHERSQKGEFIALLVGLHVRGGPVKTKAVAVVRITAENGELRYAVRYNRLDRPKFLQITDANGNVLVESPLVKRKNGERKVCGVWHKIPKVYLQYFRERRLYAVITAARHTKGLIAGPVVPHEQAEKETFSVVMGSPKPEGIGGVASLEYDHVSQKVKYVISFDGLFDQKDFNGEYYVTVEKNSKLVHQSMGRIGKRSNTLTGTWKMTKRREAKQLARGRLLLRLTSRGGNTISGDIQPRLSCGVYQAVLSGFQSLKKSKTAAAGTAIIELQERGYISYNVRVVGLDSKVTRIKLETAPNKKGKRKSVANLHKSFVEDGDSFSGWANGTYKKLKADAILLLLSNQLFVNVATSNHKTSELRGRVTEIPFHTHFQDASVFPTTLVPVTPESHGGAAHAWLSMDLGCSLHYDVIVSPEQVDDDFSLMLGTYGNSLMSTSVLGTSQKQEPVQLLENRMISGSVNSVPEGLFRDLDEGNAFLQVNSGDDIILAGNVTLQNTCWQYAGDIDTDILVGEQRDGRTVVDRFHCYYEGNYYDNGDSWKPVENATCNRCSCNKGNVTCHAVLCPALTCARPVPGECCPRCPDVSMMRTRMKNETCKLGGDHRLHQVGTTWHPFLPLSGFSKCVLCKCVAGGVSKCSRLPCPNLDCPYDERIRLQPGACCQVCGPKKERFLVPEVKPLKDIDMKGACTFMDQLHSDGSRWHPKIAPFGHMKCVVCRCNGGKYSCGRQKCPKLRCKRKIRRSNSCCYSCDPNQPSKDDVSKSEGSCNFGGRNYNNGEKWRPRTAPNGNVRCAVCKCKDNTVKCRIRCSKRRCAKDPFLRDPCCKECAARRSRKNNRERSSKEKRKGRLH